MLAAACLLISACTSSARWSWPEDSDPSRTEGQLVSAEHLGGYSHLLLRGLFWLNDLSDRIPTHTGVELYRIVYWTRAPDGRLVRASALVGVPRGDATPRGVVSWQHGTASLRAAAPSSLDTFNGVFPAAIISGRGYLLVAPDYLGFGVSEEPHAYYHTDSMASWVVDALAAARRLADHNGMAWPDALFLSGFSQGAHASLAAQRRIESGATHGLTVAASAPVAAAVDLPGHGVRSALEGRSRFSSLYIAWVALTYSRAYEVPLSQLVREPWARQLPVLFDGHHDGDVITTTLPANPRELLLPDVVQAIEAGDAGHWFVQRLRENSLTDFVPRAPVRIYYGEADVDVVPEHARMFEREARSRGADVTAISVGDVDHEGTILAAIPEVFAWFDELADRESRARQD